MRNVLAPQTERSAANSRRAGDLPVHFRGKLKALSQIQPWLKFTIHPFTSAHFIPNLDQLYLICFVFSHFDSGQKSNIVSLFQVYGWNLIFLNFILFHSQLYSSVYFIIVSPVICHSIFYFLAIFCDIFLILLRRALGSQPTFSAHFN